jgi:hypothetical protein
MLTIADIIWNRACQGNAGSAHLGDNRLAVMLRFHGRAMNGGVLHAIEGRSRATLHEVKQAFEYFNLPAVSAFISKAERIIRDTAELSDFEGSLIADYGATASDSVLFDRFLQKLAEEPTEFEPIQ